jgi:mannitol/fructose-specific phosphotransferase system IIA component (Ntr-type)
MDLLTEELITTSLQAADRDGVIAELVGMLVAQGLVDASGQPQVMEALLTREGSQSTGLGAQVAIPHGLSEEVDDVVAALGIHQGGVEWDALDGEPVKLVILLVVPPNRFQSHVRTLAGIARVLNDPSLRALLLEASDPRTVLDILIEREEAAFF